jgi:hypothetical protein
MNSALNESHVCLIKKWSIFQKMKTSEQEIEKYLNEVAKTVAAETVRRYPGLLQEIGKLEKEHWFDVYPGVLANFRQQGIAFLKFGIEGIEPAQIVRTDANGWFRAYVYGDRSEQHEALFSALDALIQTVPGPNGFDLDINGPGVGYYYTKQLSPLAPDKLTDVQYLTSYLLEPLVSAVEWYNKHSKEIVAIQPTRIERV